MRNLAVLAATAVILALTVATGSAGAAFPGENGLIGFSLECCSGSDASDATPQLVAETGGRSRGVNGGGGVGVAFSPDGRRIAYAQEYGFGLRVKRTDGRGRERRLTGQDDFDPDWSPTGRRLVFARILNQGDFPSELRIKSGGESRHLIDGSDPAWSIKGKIAFSRSDNAIYVIRPEGSGLHRVVERGSEPDWSPDGRRIVYTGRDGIWVVRADGKGARRLRGGSSPSFSPDGRKIVYIGPSGRLEIMGAWGKRPHRVPVRNVFYPDESLLQPDWQPLPRHRRH
jgi:Tol biopolymer transport system component